MKNPPSSRAVVEKVANARYAIGCSGIGYKRLPLGGASGSACYDTSADAAYSGKYPLARYLYVYSNKKAEAPLGHLRREFISKFYRGMAKRKRK